MNNLQLYVILLFLGASALSWLFKQLKAKAAVKRADQDRHRRTEEQLRTGRTPTAEAAASGPGQVIDTNDAQARLRDLAQRRQQQLRELRKKAQSGQTGGESGDDGERPVLATSVGEAAGGPVQRELWPGGPVVVIGPMGGGGGRGAGSAAPPASRPRGTSAAGPINQGRDRSVFSPQAQSDAAGKSGPSGGASGPRPMSGPERRSAEKARAVASAAKEKKSQSDQADRTRAAKRAVASEVRQGSATGRAILARSAKESAAAANAPQEPAINAAALIPGSLKEWRRALVISEILNEPVGLRRPQMGHAS